MTFHFPEARQLNIALKFHTHYLEQDQLRLKLKPYSSCVCRSHQQKQNHHQFNHLKVLHTLKSAPLLLPPKKSKRYTNPVFFNPILILLLYPFSFTTRKDSFQFDRASTTSLYTSLQLQIPCTCSLPTPQTYSTSNQGRIQNPVEHLRLSFFTEIVNLLRPLAIFAEEYHRECLTGF